MLNADYDEFAGGVQTARPLIAPPPPRITIVTPTYNMAATLEVTLNSVLDQHYPALEYIVVDGGSTDGSCDILRRRAGQLCRWSSGADGGMYDALNKGFAGTTGEIMGWLNGDDLHLPWTLSTVADIFRQCPEVEWITSLYPLVYMESGQPCSTHYLSGFTRASFMRGANLPGAGVPARGFIQQESTFWRRSLWERAGGHVETNCGPAGDFELWTRFFQHAPLYGVAIPLAGFRRRTGQLSDLQRARYIEQAQRVLAQAGGRQPGALANSLRRTVHKLMGRQPLARQLPNQMRRALCAVGLLSPAGVIRFRDDRWRVEVEYVV